MYNQIMNNRKQQFLIIFFLVIIILGLVFLIRNLNGNPIFAGDSFYYDLRVAEDISLNNYWDSLQGRMHKITGAHYLLSWMLPVLGLEFLPFISIVLGLISAFALFSLLEIFFKDKKIIFISTLLFVLSPIFIYVFTRINGYTFALPLLLFFAYFFTRKKLWSIPLLMIVSFLDPVFFLISAVIVLLYGIYKKWRYYLAANLILSLLSFTTFALFNNSYLSMKIILFNPSIQQILTTFGARVGVSFFYFFLSIIGFFTVWQRKRENTFALITLLLLLALGIFNSVARLFLNIYFSILAGILLAHLFKREWAIDIIKRFTLLLIFCGIIFSTAVYMDQLYTAQPTEETVSALKYLLSEPQGKVLSHEEYGQMIEYYAGKKVLLDSHSIQADNYDFIKDQQQKLFYSRNLEQTENLLYENQVSYIFVTSDMQNGAVWSEEEQGLLFLLENSMRFEKLYSDEIIIWKYLR